ncbi:MAG: hypothetical protein ABFS86_18295 [Planctomycetota bacterium]
MAEAGVHRLPDEGDVAWITPAEGASLTDAAEVVTIDGVSFPGGPTLLRLGGRLAALEQAEADRWALRPLADEDEARAFLERRREEYDRMWDGCGCRIDYEN